MTSIDTALRVVGRHSRSLRHKLLRSLCSGAYDASGVQDELRQRLSPLCREAEKKGRTKAEVDEIIRWLTGYSDADLAAILNDGTNFEDFYGNAPALNLNRSAIKGLICGIRVEEIEDPLMRELRYLDKLIDELAKGKKMEKILKAEAVTK